MDIFKSEFPDYKPDFSLIVAVSAPMFLFQAVVFFFLQYIPMQVKMTFVFFLMAVDIILIALIPNFISNEAVAYWIVIGIAVVIGICMATLQATLYGAAGPSAELTNLLTLGMGVSGLSINTARIFFLAFVSDQTVSGYIFFFTSSAFLIVCAVLSAMFVKEQNAENRRKLLNKQDDEIQE